MRYQTHISRADLLRCLDKYGEAKLAAMAAALGYEPRPAREEPTKPPSPPVGESPPPESAPSTVSAIAPKTRFYRVTAQRHFEPEEVVSNEPVWYRNASVFVTEDQLGAPPNVPPPLPEPLMRWSRLWPFLKTALSTRQATHALDLPLIVARLARMRSLRYLPRKQRQAWASDCQVIVDYASPLLPFWTDFNQLCRRLRDWRGQSGLRLIALPEGDPGAACWLWVGKEWRPLDHCPSPGPATAILVLSDLGCNDLTAVRRRQWQRLGLAWQRAGGNPVALLPCPPRWWEAELMRLFYPVCWDRAVRPPQHRGARRPLPAVVERGEREAGAEQLLALLAADQPC